MNNGKKVNNDNINAINNGSNDNNNVNANIKKIIMLTNQGNFQTLNKSLKLIK